MTPLSDAALVRLQDAIERPTLPDPFTPVEIIGEGGMGVVWRARDAALDRDVAVKVIAPHLVDDSFSDRLRREAKVLAHLEHPGIVPVHAVGVLADGRAWYAMRLVRGTRLDVAARATRTRGDLLRVMERLCDIVAFAHSHGVIHRDLKPANVMLGPFGEVLVLDWGVVIGTPGYMAPEQASGGEVTERSDVYGLGAILRDLCDVHAEAIPGPLRSIRDRATARRPEDRYATPVELRDDLRRFVDGYRVSAHRETALDTLSRFASVYRTPILLVAAYLIMRLAIFAWRGV